MSGACCPLRVCSLAEPCPNGVMVDAFGCETCRCRPNPCSPQLCDPDELCDPVSDNEYRCIAPHSAYLPQPVDPAQVRHCSIA